MLAHFSYQNNSDNTLIIGVGQRNKFTPGRADLGQPTEFLKGRVSNVLITAVPAGASLRWVLGDAFVDASVTTPRCQPAPVNCTDINVKDLLAKIDSTSANMKKIVTRIAGRVIASNATAAEKRRAQAYIDRADILYGDQWADIWGNFPQVIRLCPSCQQIDKRAAIIELNARQRSLYRLVNLSADLAETADPNGQLASVNTLVNLATKLNGPFESITAQLPRFQSKCD